MSSPASPRWSRLVAVGLSTLVAGSAAAGFLLWYLKNPGVLDFQSVDRQVFERLSGEVQAADSAYRAGGLRRVPMDEELVSKILPMMNGRQRVYDPYCYFRYEENIDKIVKWDEHSDGEFRMRTNSLGIRRDGELADEKPDLRVLVAGDSHIDGVCANSESFAGQLETLLKHDSARSVEVINAAHGAYNFYHYLGCLERFIELGLAPDVFIVVVYGGNDFLGTYLWHFFEGTKFRHDRALLARKKECSKLYPAAFGQALNALIYFKDGGQDEIVRGLQMGRLTTRAMATRCAAEGIELLVVYLPAPLEVPAVADQTALQAGIEFLQFDATDVTVIGEMANRYLAGVSAEGIDMLDLRARFGLEHEQLYWQRDLHLNVRGHELVAESVAPWVEARWAQR